jgi:hypothetical protein
MSKEGLYFDICLTFNPSRTVSKIVYGHGLAEMLEKAINDMTENPITLKCIEIKDSGMEEDHYWGY